MQQLLRQQSAPGQPSPAHLFIGHPHPEAAEPYDGIVGGPHVGEGPLEHRPQPRQVAGSEAMAGDKGLDTGEEKQETERRLQTQPRACREINALPRVSPSPRYRYRARPCRPRLTRRRHDAAPSRATAPLPPHAPPRRGTHHPAMEGWEGRRIMRGSRSSTSVSYDNLDTVKKSESSRESETEGGRREATGLTGHGKKWLPRLAGVVQTSRRAPGAAPGGDVGCADWPGRLKGAAAGQRVGVAVVSRSVAICHAPVCSEPCHAVWRCPVALPPSPSKSEWGFQSDLQVLQLLVASWSDARCDRVVCTQEPKKYLH